MATEIHVDHEHGIEVWNDTDVRTDDLIRAMQADPMIAALTKWQTSTQGGGRRARGGRSIIDRDRFVTPVKIFDQFRVAIDAVENDDTVGGWMETTENLMFEDAQFECDQPYEQDIWNQVAEDLELEERMRESYRGFASCSQVYPLVWWGQKSYKVQGAKTAAGKSAKKTFDNLTVPMAITYLDPCKVTPVGNLFFNMESLAYLADYTEVDALDAAALGDPDADPIARRMITGKYTPTSQERRLLGEQGIDTNRLYSLNPANVFRYTATRLQHNRFASVRMKPVFELLDLKHQLREMDRAFLVGGMNFLLVVTQGSDKQAGTAAEIAKLGMSMRSIGRVPLIIGDHRVEVKIVVPPQEHVLNNEKHSTIEARMVAYLYRMVMISHGGSKSGDDQLKVAKMVAKGLNAVRKRQGKIFMRRVFKRMWEQNDQLTTPAKMKFAPRRIELDFDPGLAQLLLDIYNHRDISRDTMLSLVDVDQAEEAAKKQYEAEQYDDIFQTIIPFTAPADGSGDGSGSGDGGQQPIRSRDPKTSGRTKGGNRSGGGAAPGKGQGQAPQDPRPKPADRRATAAVEPADDDDDDGAGGDE